MIRWILIIKEFGPNIQHISGVDNIVDDNISRSAYKSIVKYAHSTRKAQCHANELFGISRTEKNQYCFLLNILNVQREQKKELRNRNYKISTYISDQESGYCKQALDNSRII